MSSPGEPPSDVDEQAPPAPRRPRGRTAAAALLAVLGLGALIGGGTGLALELTREPTAQEKETAAAKERALRWRYLTPGEIFPASVPYGGASRKKTARRVGIVPETACADAFDRQLADIMVKHGCRTMLRATYLDDSGTQAATVGVAVMPGTDQVLKANNAFQDTVGFQAERKLGVRAHGFPGTVAAGFDDAARQMLSMETSTSTYIYFRTAGWVDGRSRVEEKYVADAFSFAGVVMREVQKRFSETRIPCLAVGVEC